MNTPTHLLVSAALLTKPNATKDNLAVVAGSLTPDLSIYVLFVWARLFAGIDERTLWSQVYWQEPWQTYSAICNSIPLYLLLLALGALINQRTLLLFAASALIHMGLDLPFHASDAHQHFWPFSDWRFHSPLSYWDGRHYGGIVSVIEICMAVVCITLLWRRFKDVWVRALLMLGLVTYVAVPVYFRLMLG